MGKPTQVRYIAFPECQGQQTQLLLETYFGNALRLYPTLPNMPSVPSNDLMPSRPLAPN